MNQQPIEKRTRRVGAALDVHSIFHTIQGEGPFSGTPSVFVRLAGCNLQCPACDTEYTAGRVHMPVDHILHAVQQRSKSGLVVITGGEPFRQDLGGLLRLLIQARYYVQIETNGTLEPTDIQYTLDPGIRHGVYVVCSPKTGKLNPAIYDAACALKYVVSHGQLNPADGLPFTALGHTANPMVARPPPGWNRPVYVQPMDGHDDVFNALHRQAAVESCLRHGHTLQLQLHKLIGVE